MNQRIDLTGHVYGNLTIIGPSAHSKRGEAYWECECTCGKKISESGSNLRTGTKRSCNLAGHRYSDPKKIKGASTTHKSEYSSWSQMLSRCRNHKATGYRYYGGKGITVCERWSSFTNFFEDMGPKPSPEHSIDRINNDGNYTPENCRWATKNQQARNRSRKVYIEVDGVVKRLAEVADETGIPNAIIYNRVKKYGWDAKKAVSVGAKEKADDKRCPQCGGLYALIGRAHLCKGS